MSREELNRAQNAQPHAKRLIFALALALACAVAAAISAQAYVTEPATIWRIAGNGIPCADPTTSCGDGPTATAANLNHPTGVAVDGAGNVYVADTNDHKIRKVTPSGAISTIAGNGTACADPTTSCGDGPTATAANLTFPEAVAVDGAGNVYIAGNEHKVRKVTPPGAISTIAGNGTFCADPTTSCGDGPTATAASLSSPEGLAVDGAGNVYISDTGLHKIRKVTPGGAISTIAGSGTQCADPTTTCDDGATATNAELNFPEGVAVDGAGNVYIADWGDDKIRKLTPGGAISTIAGNGTACADPTSSCGDGPTATAANLNQPFGVAVDAAGNVYFADEANSKVRKVTPAGAISTIAGNGTDCANAPACGDGGAATAASLDDPEGVAVDAAGQNVFVADSDSDMIRWIAGPQAGPLGPQGPPGAAGPQGPPGKDATATCKVKKAKGTKVKVKCTVAQAASRSVLTYRLTRATASSPPAAGR